MSEQDAEGSARKNEAALEVIEVEAGGAGCLVGRQERLKPGDDSVRRLNADGPDVNVSTGEPGWIMVFHLAKLGYRMIPTEATMAMPWTKVSF